MSGFVVWFTGLSGAGKSTLAAMLSAELRARDVHVEVLDGDEVRTHLSKGLTFSREDRDINVRRIGFVAKLVARSGACAITAAISPYRAIREEIRSTIPAFFEVYCECPVPALAERDPKGLYKKALAGELKGFTGVDDPYEAPLCPELVCKTDRESKEESLAKIVGRLEVLGLVPARGGAPSARHVVTLPPPHGGELTPRLVAPSERAALAARASTLPRIALERAALIDLGGLASGLLSPLRGFMNEKDHRRVVGDMRLESGVPWARPVTLEVSDEDAERATHAGEVALIAPDGRLVALLEVSDVFRPGDRARCVGGEVRVLEPPLAAAFSTWQRQPAATRSRLIELGLSRVLGLRDAAPILRAHEYAAKCALETLDGLLLDVALDAPAAGLSADVRVRSVLAILAGYFPQDRTLLSAHAGGAERSGPRSAIDDAIALKNQGASHILVSPADGEALGLYGPSELGITPLAFEEVFHSTVTGALATEKTAPGDAPTRLVLSLEALCAAIRRGEKVPGELVRSEVVAILGEALR